MNHSTKTTSSMIEIPVWPFIKQSSLPNRQVRKENTNFLFLASTCKSISQVQSVAAGPLSGDGNFQFFTRTRANTSSHTTSCLNNTSNFERKNFANLLTRYQYQQNSGTLVYAYKVSCKIKMVSQILIGSSNETCTFNVSIMNRKFV